MYNKYYKDDLRVLGVATAFEDFDKNNLENLKLLLTTGEVIGAPRRVLGEYGRLAPGNKIGYKIPAMDTLLKVGPLTDDNVMDFRSYVAKEKESIYERAKRYLKIKQFSAKTFEEYGLRGTPSAILIDKKGVLRQTFFGSNNSLEGTVKELLNE